MSKVGQAIITIPEATTIKVEANLVTVTGPKGTLTLTLPPKLKVTVTEKEVLVERLSEDKQTRSNHGTHRAHIQNMLTGVTTGWQKELKVIGTGFKANVEGATLVLTVGFINPVKLPIPEALTVTVDQDNKITVSGTDKVLVGQFASNARKARKPDAYQGKGVRYIDEHVKLKPGKAVKSDA